MPSLTELRTIVATSKQTDWSLLQPGPYYLDRVVPTYGPEPAIELQEHDCMAVWRPDVSLAIAWGMRLYSGEVGLRYTWEFPDKAMWLVNADVFWHGCLVDRSVLVAVDGGRAMLPTTTAMTVNENIHDLEVVGEMATAYDVAVARLVNSIPDGPEEFDDYFRRANIVELPDKPDEAIT